MSNSLGVFIDPGLTIPLDALDLLFAADGSTGHIDRTVFIGSNSLGRKFQAESNPGIDSIIVSVFAYGGLPASVVRLALSSAGLLTAAPGAPVNLGLAILSGPAHAIALHVRIDVDVQPVGQFDNVVLLGASTIEVLA